MSKARESANLTSEYNIYSDINNNNVGIGTSNATSKLHVVGNVLVTGVSTATGGFNIGVSSAGSVITSGPVKTLNFVGLGNTFAVNGTTVDISIQGGGGGGATGFGTNKVFYENDTIVTDSYSITAGKNAMSAGPIQIAIGATVTIPSGSVWTIV
jgi:hypothetical protein